MYNVRGTLRSLRKYDIWILDTLTISGRNRASFFIVFIKPRLQGPNTWVDNLVLVPWFRIAPANPTVLAHPLAILTAQRL